jgi:hypothetical protein
VLDSTLAELHPKVRREVPADDPYMHPLKSRQLKFLVSLIDRALAMAGALNSDDDEPELALCEAADLTRAEYEAVVLRSDGLEWEQIANLQGVTERRARLSGERGIAKLREFVAEGHELV